MLQMGAEIRVSIADVDSFRYSAGIGLLVCQSIVGAAQKPIFLPRTKSMDTDSKIRMDSHGLCKVRVFRKNSATSSAM